MCSIRDASYKENGEKGLSADLGFYYKFKSDNVTGRPYGCTGFDSSNEENWTKVTPNCPEEDVKPDGEPFYRIVKEFADDQQGWIKEFISTFEKMVANGYVNNQLQDGPTDWFGAH